MTNVVRCPYCVEGGNFKVMMGRAEGRWFLCARCGHVVVPEKPSYQCECGNCAELHSGPKS